MAQDESPPYTWEDVEILREQVRLAWESRNEQLRDEIQELRNLIDDPTWQEGQTCS